MVMEASPSPHPSRTTPFLSHLPPEKEDLKIPV